MSLEVNYEERMLSYYPELIASIVDFQSIINAEAPEIEGINTSKDDVLDNAYLTTMKESRIKDWERVFKITPPTAATIEDRREVIIARIRGQGKLNTNVINAIVNTFTGGKANSWVENGTLYVEVTPPPSNKQYRFESIEQELKNKVPAHLGLEVSRNYYEWDKIVEDNLTWMDLKNNFTDWEDIYLYSPFGE